VNDVEMMSSVKPDEVPAIPPDEPSGREEPWMAYDGIGESGVTVVRAAGLRREYDHVMAQFDELAGQCIDDDLLASSLRQSSCGEQADS
jgi:hypothetical protein